MDSGLMVTKVNGNSTTVAFRVEQLLRSNVGAGNVLQVVNKTISTQGSQTIGQQIHKLVLVQTLTYLLLLKVMEVNLLLLLDGLERCKCLECGF